MSLAIEVKELQRQLSQLDEFVSSTGLEIDNTFEFLVFKLDDIKFKMYKEQRHKLPHIHIDYGSQNHVASYGIKPVVRLVGNLDRKYDRIIIQWISLREQKLLNLWTAIQAGKETSPIVVELVGNV